MSEAKEKDARRNRLVWIDLEMTGLDPETCAIVEIATIVTETDLTIVAEGPNLVIHQPDDVLATMAPIVVEMHSRSGLTERIRTSSVTVEQAEAETVAFIRAHVDDGTAPLAGNSIWKDRQFLERYMKGICSCLHYRMIDVSTLKELVLRWFPPEARAPKKRETHRALDDIRESIGELRHYRDRVLLPVKPFP
jgi:oligoribonuclease